MRFQERVFEVMAYGGEWSVAELKASLGVGAFGTASLFVALYGLERLGRVVSRWADVPYPRHRLYRATDAA